MAAWPGRLPRQHGRLAGGQPRQNPRGVTPASEGFIAAADRGPGDGLRLVADRGLFFEFVRSAELDQPRPDRRWLATAELGVEYALVLSSNAGLSSTIIGYTVMLTERTPPRLLVTGRTAHTLSAFGEHLITQELDAALARLNADYADHRCGGYGMLPPQVRFASPGLFAAWLARRGKLGGQNKVPRVINDPRLLTDLLASVAAGRA